MTSARLLLLVLMIGPAAAAWAALDCPPSPDGRSYHVVDLPAERRERYRNPDGSCVQCSIGMAGVACDVPAAAALLWDSAFGPRIRGGSDPARVKRYCDDRRIAAYNVYGPQAAGWAEWALATGRPAAITWGPAHMILALGYSGVELDERSYIAVCDNNSPQRVQWVSRAQFRARLAAFGDGWCVILCTPPPAGAAAYIEWWSE